MAEARSAGNLTRRVDAALTTDAWTLMSDQWKGLVFNLLKNAASGSVEDNRGKRRVGRRGGRGDRAMLQDYPLEDIDSLIMEDGDSDYQMAALLTHKAIAGEGWDVSINAELHRLRQQCEANGVHPLFHRMADDFQSVLGEMKMFEAVLVKEDEDPTWLERCRIDATDSEKVIAMLEPPLGVHLSAAALNPLKRLHTQLQRKGGFRPQWLEKQLVPSVLELKSGGGGLLAATLSLAAQKDDAEERFLTLCDEEGEVGEIAGLQNLLMQITRREDEVWSDCISLSGDDSLTQAIRARAWALTPWETEEVDLNTLLDGEKEMNEWCQARDLELDSSSLLWNIIRLMVESDRQADAEPYLERVSICHQHHLNTTLALVGGDARATALAKIKAVVNNSDGINLAPLLDNQDVPVEVRLEASNLLEESGDANEKEERMMLELYVNSGDMPALANHLAALDDSAATHPHLTLLTARLIGAENEAELLDWAKTARRRSFLALSDAECPNYLSAGAFALISMLDGGSADMVAVSELLNAEGLQVFKQCRRAMMEDGDGLVPEQVLQKLQEEVVRASDEEMGAVEKMLFTQLILNLHLNRADSELQKADTTSHAIAEEIIESVLATTPPTDRILRIIDAQVMEHGVASRELEKWYKTNHPRTMQAYIASARYADKRGGRQQAARAYRNAAEKCHDFEMKQKLNKEALISFAHAECWAEAIEILETEAGLKVNITERFRLYLECCDEAARGRMEKARDLVLASVREIRNVEKTNREGETYEVEEVFHKQDELNLLLTYPSTHRLPEEPFRGRVLAALNRVQRGRRRRGGELESRFQSAISRRDFREIRDIANDAEELRGPEHGLLFYERAMDSGTFDVAGLQRISNMEQVMYQRSAERIPVRKRAHLKNLALKPLVLIDTNLLIDALVERVLHHLEINRETPLHLDSRREFHRTLLFHRMQGKADINIPAVVRSQLLTMMKWPDRIKDICGEKLVNPAAWDEKIDEQVLTKLANEVLDEYSSWSPPKEMGVNKVVQEGREDMEQFLLELRDIYREVTNAKKRRGHHSHRYEIKGEKIYPEKSDIDIMLFTAYLANEPLDGFGSILLATRDSDFTIPGRTLQEKYGFVVVDNAQAFSRYTF